MPEGRKEGLASAIEATGPGERPVVGELLGDLFDLDPVVRSPRRKADAVSGEKRGPGRPKGAKNKRSSDWVAFLGSQYTLPLEGMVALGDMSPAELLQDLADQAERLTGKRIDFSTWQSKDVLDRLERLLGVIQAARNAAAPYLHERRGMVVEDGEGNDVPVLALFAGVGSRPAIGAASAGLPFDVRPRNRRDEGNQALIEGDAGKSSGEKSSDDDK